MDVGSVKREPEVSQRLKGLKNQRVLYCQIFLSEIIPKKFRNSSANVKMDFANVR